MPDQKESKIPFDIRGILGHKADSEKEFKPVAKPKPKEDAKENGQKAKSDDEQTGLEGEEAIKADTKKEIKDGEAKDKDGVEKGDPGNEVDGGEDGDDSSEAGEDSSESDPNSDGSDDSSSSESGDEAGEGEDKDLKDSGQEDKPSGDPAPEFNIYEVTDGVFETKEELQSTSKLLKENPELKKMLEYYEKNGTLLPYLQATQIDPDKFSDHDIVWQAFKSENADLELAEEDLKLLFEEDVMDKYNLDSEDENKVKIGLARLKKDANGYRKQLKEDLQSLLLPAERDVQAEAASKLEQEAAKKKEANKNKLAFQIRKEIKEGKISVDVGEDISVKLDASPRKISDLLDKVSDPAFLMDDKGNFDLKRMAILVDPSGFIKSVMDSSKALGKGEFIQTDLKGRPTKGKTPEGNGSAPEPVKRFNPKDPSTWKGIKLA